MMPSEVSVRSVAGQKLQFVVLGGAWKASKILTDGQFGYGLIGEAVSLGFEYEDMELGKTSSLRKLFPQRSKPVSV